MTYTHGGDIITAQAQYQGEITDFSANLNPLGMPESVRVAAAQAARTAIHYPDPHCRILCHGIALRDKVQPEHVICGNGAADLIFRLCYALRPKRALITAPTFSEYEQALRAAGCELSYHMLQEEHDFIMTDQILSDLTEDLDLVFLCMPNNPTGNSIPCPLMDRILARCRQLNIRPIIDECFLELSDAAVDGGLSNQLEEVPTLVLLRAFTKSYAIAGLRLGYALTADKELSERLALAGQPWSVSTPAQAAGIAALREGLHPILARELIAAERVRLSDAMIGLGLKVYPSTANYLLFRAIGKSDLREQLLNRGILIRSCANYIGLGPDYYRIAVRLKGENDLLLRELKAVLSWPNPL